MPNLKPFWNTQDFIDEMRSRPDVRVKQVSTERAAQYAADRAGDVGATIDDQAFAAYALAMFHHGRAMDLPFADAIPAALHPTDAAALANGFYEIVGEDLIVAVSTSVTPCHPVDRKGNKTYEQIHMYKTDARANHQLFQLPEFTSKILPGAECTDALEKLWFLRCYDSSCGGRTDDLIVRSRGRGVWSVSVEPDTRMRSGHLVFWVGSMLPAIHEFDVLPRRPSRRQEALALRRLARDFQRMKGTAHKTHKHKRGRFIPENYDADDDSDFTENEYGEGEVDTDVDDE